VTSTRVALLRGINVGKAKRIPMADLRRVVESLGFGDVRTLLNSGNVVFSVPEKTRGDIAPRIQAAIRDRVGVTTRVTVLEGAEVTKAVRENPLIPVAVNPSRLLFMVPTDQAALATLKPLLTKRWAPESLAIGSRVAYLWCPGGVIASTLAAAVNRCLGEACTARNLATMTKLAAIVERT
jgi:uncharacterized protein (DUF1697 family)